MAQTISDCLRLELGARHRQIAHTAVLADDLNLLGVESGHALLPAAGDWHTLVWSSPACHG
jgi:hypothetical protein